MKEYKLPSKEIGPDDTGYVKHCNGQYFRQPQGGLCDLLSEAYLYNYSEFQKAVELALTPVDLELLTFVVIEEEDMVERLEWRLLENPLRLERISVVKRHPMFLDRILMTGSLNTQDAVYIYKHLLARDETPVVMEGIEV